MKYRTAKPIFTIILVSDIVATILFLLSIFYAWNYEYKDNYEYRYLLWGYIRTESFRNRVSSYKNFDNFYEFAAIMAISHIIYVIVGIFICVSDSKRIYPSTNGQLRRTNFVISLFFMLYSLYQIMMMLIWTFFVNKIKFNNEIFIPDMSINENPRSGYWFSITAIVCQLYATIVRFIMTIIVRN